MILVLRYAASTNAVLLFGFCFAGDFICWFFCVVWYAFLIV